MVSLTTMQKPNQLCWLYQPTAKASTSLINAPLTQEDSTHVKHRVVSKQIQSKPNFLWASSKQTAVAAGPPMTSRNHTQPRSTLLQKTNRLTHRSKVI